MVLSSVPTLVLLDNNSRLQPCKHSTSSAANLCFKWGCVGIFLRFSIIFPELLTLGGCRLQLQIFHFKVGVFQCYINLHLCFSRNLGVQPQVFEAATEIKIANRNLRGNGAKLSGVTTTNLVNRF